MALGPDDLLLSYMAMTRVEPMWRFFGASFEERCIAAEAGGFAAIGLVPEVYDEARAAGHSDDDLQAMLATRGLVVGELELPVTFPSLAQKDSVVETLEHTLEIADRFGAERLLTVASAGLTEQEVAEAFGWICDRCAEHGLLASLEFVSVPGHTSVLDPPTAVRIVEAAGRSNGGITVDACHHFNGSAEWAELEAIPGELITAIQFDDTEIPRLEPDWVEGTPHHRKAPGEGDADLVRFVRTMDALGAACPYSIEVIDREIVALPPVALGERLGRTTRSVLAKARAQGRPAS
jgi:sugar phosphate isomerase/epimerase